MNILSINFNHDGAACIVQDGEVTGYVCTERLSRIKKQPGIRNTDLSSLLSQAGIRLGDLDHVILLNLDNCDSAAIIEAYGTDFKEERLSFKLHRDNKRVTIEDQDFPCWVNHSHHQAHAALAYLASPFESAIAWVWDPLASVGYHCFGSTVDYTPCLTSPLNCGLLYTYAARCVFQYGLFDSGKLMGLAPYGHLRDVPNSIPCDAFSDDPQDILRQINADAALHPVWIEETTGQRWNARVAYLTQSILEQAFLQILDKLFELCSKVKAEPNLVLSGGTALNSVANELAFTRSKFERVYIHPACGDDGTAIGAALDFYYRATRKRKRGMTNRQAMYGRASYDDQIADVVTSAAQAADLFAYERTDYIDQTAALLAEGATVAWFQGAAEIGPRALGHRSILADPRSDQMKDRLNREVKFRESFRPFAPAVPIEAAATWFSIHESPFMLRVGRVRFPEKIPAATHVDGTARVQTVARNDNTEFYELLRAFERRTGVPVLVNTSFNVKGEPIVETPSDALACFQSTGIDYLVFPGLVVSKQPLEFGNFESDPFA